MKRYLNINEKRVKSALSDYISGNIDRLDDIVGLLGEFIYFFPQVVYGASDDVCSDFYLWVVERIKRILLSYKDMGYRFITWFSVVLKNEYNSFMQRRAKDYIYISPFTSLQFNISLYEGDYNNFVNTNIDKMYAILAGAIYKLALKIRIVLVVYFVMLFELRIFVDVSKEYGKKSDEILVFYDNLLKVYEKRLARYYYILNRISSIHTRLNIEESPLLKRKKDRYIKKLEAIKLTTDYNTIADYVGIPVGTVAVRVKRGKEALQAMIKEVVDDVV